MAESTSGGKPLVLRTAQDREDYRKSLHKSNCSPAWKSTYRKRCLERLKTSRKKFWDRFRHTEADGDPSTGNGNGPGGRGRTLAGEELTSSIQEVMMEEWEQLRSEHSDLPLFPGPGPCPGTRHSQKRRASFPECTAGGPSMAKRRSRDLTLGSDADSLYDDVDEDIDSVLSVMDELTQELIKEEQAILAQYEADIQFDEEALCAAINCLSTTNDVICPICQKSILHQNKHVIFCTCGVRLDTAQDGITLDYVRKQLEECCSQHSMVCRGTAVFSLEDTLGIRNIIMNCTVCEFMEIIV